MMCYTDRAPDLRQRMAAVVASRGDAIAVIEGEQRFSYAEIDRQAASIAAVLARRGVAPGDRVAVMLANGVDAVRAILAILRLGAVLVAVSARSRSPELAYVFADCTPVAILHGHEFADVVEQAEPLPAIRYDVSGKDWLAAMTDDTFDAPVPDINEDSLFAILYTSGTTGRPKGAMLTHLGAIHSCLHWRDAFALDESDRTLMCVPWAHVSGLCGVVMPFLYLGATLVMLPEFKRRAALKMAVHERITHALMVPAMYGLCLLEPDLAEFDLRTWRIAAYGGAPMPEPTITRFSAAVPSVAMCNAYGATETSSPVTIMPPGEGLMHLDSIGQVVVCGDVRAMDEQGREVPPGADGELWIAGPMVSPGYWQNREATAAAFTGGFWKSGDIGNIDANGYVRIADRKKDMVIRGGFKIYPAEVESVIAGLEGVIESAVVGRNDVMLGEAVVAFVTVNSDSITPAVVHDWCVQRLSDYKVPGEVIVGTTPLPRNANGKIQKADLRERAARLTTAAMSERAA
ncbi:class I adenylate-forming enzyme family protein [Sphingomonas glacialis]|nr:class I adenylate-forming enzyme family protein [Sphingomonas glacialis]